MEFNGYWLALRRRWRLVAGCVVAVMVLGVLVFPHSDQSKKAKETTRWQATETLLYNKHESPYNLDQLAFDTA